MNAYDVLNERGFIAEVKDKGRWKPQVTDVRAVRGLLGLGTTVYQGFDPSAASFHLGHLLSIMALHHIQEGGNRVIFLLGGATGRVGDPKGLSTRELLTKQQIDQNAESLRAQVENMGLLSFSDNRSLMLNNDDWIAPEPFLDFFLMEIARHFSVNEMLKMQTFATRLQKKKPLSLLEFLYPTLQAWDFMHLFNKLDCTIQVGGQDQWANILQGVDLVKRHSGSKKTNVQGLTFPLLLTASGEKMGKTEKGPVWLDPKLTSPFDFYQYLRRTEDKLVPRLFRFFTFLELGEIDEIVAGDPVAAQERLAFEVTKVVHGETEAKKAARGAKSASAGGGSSKDVPTLTVKSGTKLLDAIRQAGDLKSNSVVRRLFTGNAIEVDEVKVTDPNTRVTKACLVKYGKGKFVQLNIE